MIMKKLITDILSNPWNLKNIHFQILPVNIKGLAGSVATLANWLTAFATTMTANLLLNWNSGGLFLSPTLCALTCLHVSWTDKNSWSSTATFTLYTVVSAFAVVFAALWVPETKGRTLEEIQQSFRWFSFRLINFGFEFAFGHAKRWF